jgi:hypothetical protein
MKNYFTQSRNFLFDNETTDIMEYNKYFNPKIKNNKWRLGIINDENMVSYICEDNLFLTNYDPSDYDTLDDLD